MAKNLVQYVKIGFGTVLAPLSALHEIGIEQSRQVAQAALYRTLQTITPETLATARQTIDAYIQQNGSSENTVLTAGLTVIGVSMIASGIYNLAKNYRSEIRR